MRILVTGSRRGIGAAIAAGLAEPGHTLLIHHLAFPDEAERVAGGCRERGAEAKILEADLSDPAAIRSLVSAAGEIDILVNNAARASNVDIGVLPLEEWQATFAVNVTAPMLLAQAFSAGMAARGWGRIVNISSVHGLRASPYKSAYVTAKHGLEGLSKVIALEGAPHGVTSNCVNPAYVRTPLVENQIAAQAKAHGIPEDEVVERVMLAASAVKRLVEPAEVAEAVAYLCSPAAASITGSSLVMDGGWTAH